MKMNTTTTPAKKNQTRTRDTTTTPPDTTDGTSDNTTIGTVTIPDEPNTNEIAAALDIPPEQHTEYILEAFIHLHGRDHWCREVFPVSEIKQAQSYIIQMLKAKYAYELPDSEWKNAPSEHTIMYWPGDPYIDTGDHESLGEALQNTHSTKGYIKAKPLRRNAADAVEEQATHPQVFREKQTRNVTVWNRIKSLL